MCVLNEAECKSHKAIMAEDTIETYVKASMKIYSGNKATINISNNYVLCDRTKYIEVDKILFIKENNDFKELVLPYVKIQDQMVDVFIKGLSMGILEKNSNKLAYLMCLLNLNEF